MKPLQKKVLLTNTIVALFSITSSMAQSNNRAEQKERPTTEEVFTQMDTNKDEKLSVKEVKGPIKNDFDKIDTDKDGFITKEELNNAPKPKKRGHKRKND